MTNGALAATGADGLIAAAIAAVAALAVGILLMLLVRRRKGRSTS
ncbi:MAG TPA: LPXTG cell wall anchor domain-containing protein [Arthrobacter sp.]